jgi:putative nucleotidyltransferase with HDIG domain
MINIVHAKEEFEKHVNTYDLENSKINLKYHHSYRVADICKSIAVSLKLTDEEIDLAYLIGLLHDIGRFEQLKIYNSYNDMKTVDHGDFGVKILFDNNLIRNFIETDKYDDIIRTSIYAHNKAFIPSSYNEKDLLFTQIIRDADKLDILYLYIDKQVIIDVSDENISNEVIECILNRKLIECKIAVTPLDNVILSLDFTYDFNFNYSLKLLKEKDYMNIIIDSLELKTDMANNTFNHIKEEINKYLNNIGDDIYAR